jgi:uncharacterized protein involved in outer membrane biogenesis
MRAKLAAVYASRIRPRRKKILIGVVVFLALFTITGFFVLPPLVKTATVRALSGSLHRDVTIRQIRINPYTLSVTVRGLSIRDRSGGDTFVSCEEIFLNLQALSALRMVPVLKEVKLTRPYVRIVRNRDLLYNFSDLMEGGKEEKPRGKPMRFFFHNIRIVDGSIDFVDGPRHASHTVRELDVGVPFLSNMPSYAETYVKPHFSARINGTLYRLEGRTKPFADSLETSIDIDIRGLDIPYYLAYVPVKTAFSVASAYLDARMKVSFIQTGQKRSSVTMAGDVSLRKVAVNDGKANPLLGLSLLDVAIAPSEPLSGIIHLTKVRIESPEFDIARDRKGVFNYAAVFPAKDDKKPDAGKVEDTAPLSLDIDEMRLTGGKIAFSDLSWGAPFKTILYPIDLKIDHFSNRKDAKSAYELSVETEAKESVKASGGFSLDPLQSEGRAEFASVCLKKYNPFLKGGVLFEIVDGTARLAANYRYAKGEKEPEIGLSGISVALDALRLRESAGRREFLSIPGLTLGETDLISRGRKSG